MAAKRSETSALLTAAQAFDAALGEYARLSELFLKTPTTTTKHLDRINETLTAISACEQKLGETGKALVEALSGARVHQEGLARQVVDRLPEIRDRNEELRAFVTRLEQIGQETAALNTESADLEKTGPTPNDEAVRQLGTKILELSARASEIAANARESGFEEVAQQAHALHQRLLAVGKRLQRAAPA